jgi:hypothetical protein
MDIDCCICRMPRMIECGQILKNLAAVSFEAGSSADRCPVLRRTRDINA